MHDTENPDVKGFLDKRDWSVDGVHVRGWCFHTGIGIIPLRFVVGNLIIIPTIEDRSDVAAFYKRDDIINCGWTATLPAGGTLEGLINETWTPLIQIKNINTTLSTYIAPSFVVVDNFYADPDSVRAFALRQPFSEHKEYHKGNRTDTVYRFPGLKERFEQIVGRKIVNWTKYGTNGCFQYCVAGDQLVYHCDTQQYAGVLYLTPNAPAQTGTQLFRSRITNLMQPPLGSNEFKRTFAGGFLDRSNFEMIDSVGNVYNRLILFDSATIHAATEYFGTTKENGRLFQLFFFDMEE
jgi:hypothetical protein